MKKKILIIFIILLISSSIYIVFYIKNYQKQQQERLIKKEQEKILTIKSHFDVNVITNKETMLYEKTEENYKETATVFKDVELELEEQEIDSSNDEFFKLKNTDYYIKYDAVNKNTDFKLNSKRYKNYVLFNENIITAKEAILYNGNDKVYKINEELNLPIIIKKDNEVYVEYDNKLLSIKKEHIKETISTNNSNHEIAKNISVIAYHYTYDSSLGEKCLSTIICHDVTQIKEQFNYLNENNYYTTNMEELEMFLKNEIRLPKKSVSITVDDGWWFDRMALLANEYKVNITLFFIGILQNNADIISYSKNSEYIDFASHTYDLHNLNVCPGDLGSPLKCSDKKIVLEDLKKSREQLDNTTYFAWPFYEYNNYAIENLKEAGFTMSLAGGMKKAVPGVNMFTVPRYTIHNDTTIKEFINYIN